MPTALRLLPQLNEYISAISLAQARAEECIHKMIDADPDNHGQYYDDIEAEEDRSRQEIFRLTQTISTVNEALAAPGIAAAATAAAAALALAQAAAPAGGGGGHFGLKAPSPCPRCFFYRAPCLERTIWGLSYCVSHEHLFCW